LVRLCNNRYLRNRPGECFLRLSNHDYAFQNDGRPSGFEFHHGFYCDDEMSDICPFREHRPRPKRESQDLPKFVDCPHCGGRHFDGSASQKFCREYAKLKHLLSEMESRNESWVPEGSTEDPFEGALNDFWQLFLWNEIRYLILKRDNYTCQDCGLKCENGENDGNHLEVHHIIPRSKGGTHHPRNLKTVCDKCHHSYTAELHRENGRGRQMEKLAIRVRGMPKLEEYLERAD